MHQTQTHPTSARKHQHGTETGNRERGRERERERERERYRETERQREERKREREKERQRGRERDQRGQREREREREERPRPSGQSHLPRTTSFSVKGRREQDGSKEKRAREKIDAMKGDNRAKRETRRPKEADDEHRTVQPDLLSRVARTWCSLQCLRPPLGFELLKDFQLQVYDLNPCQTPRANVPE